MLDTTQLLNYIPSGFFYLAAAIIGALSLSAIYILVSYGRSRVLSVIVSVIYVIIFLGLVGAGQTLLRQL